MKKLTGIISLILAAVMLFSASSFAAVQGVKPPRTADETAEKWVVSLGTSYADAPSIPVLSGKFIYCMSGKKIVKLDKESGETVASGNMSGRPTYAYVPVTVAGGKVFCPIGDGVIEAFDAETLEKLWTSTDPLGGQAMTRIKYHDGRIYTGFWNSDVDDANFDCIDASDGSIIWSIARKGGYYWAECAIKDDYLILGGEDGDDINLDSKMEEAIQFVIESGQASTSMLQRRLKVGYARAGRMIDDMEQLGIVGPHQGSKPRDVLMTYNEWLERRNVLQNSQD